MSCIIDNLSEATKASLASAEVVLGLLPTLLAVISPSIAELALLSVHRPLLATIISIGSPGVLQTRIFEYEDPAETLDLPDATHGITRLALALGPWGPTVATIISLLEYAVVLASATNVLYLSTTLGFRSICSWGCDRSWPPVLWAIFPLVIFMVGAQGYRLTLDPATRHKNAPVLLHKQGSFFTDYPTQRNPSPTVNTPPADKTMPTTTADPIFSPQSYSPEPTPQGTTNFGSRVWALIKREVLPCAAHPDTVINNRLPLVAPNTRVKVGIMLNCVAGFLSCMHLLYGTVVFASFNFIEIIDVISNIALRYLASSIACRLVIMIEVAGMRGARMRMNAERQQNGNYPNAVDGAAAQVTAKSGRRRLFGKM